MIGSGVNLIIDTMTMNNMFKKLVKGKGIVMGLSKAEIDENKISGTGFFGAGNKSWKLVVSKKLTNGPGLQKGLLIKVWILVKEVYQYSTNKKNVNRRWVK